MSTYRTSSIVAASSFVTGIALMGHEWAHVLAGWLAGGTPTLVTSTEVLGDYSSLTTPGFVALGFSGSAFNVVLCAFGWWGLQRFAGGDDALLTAWFCYAINGMLVTTKMIGESLAGWGDWMTILNHLPLPTVMRGLVCATGLTGLIVMVRSAGPALPCPPSAGQNPDIVDLQSIRSLE